MVIWFEHFYGDKWFNELIVPRDLPVKGEPEDCDEAWEPESQCVVCGSVVAYGVTQCHRCQVKP